MDDVEHPGNFPVQLAVKSSNKVNAHAHAHTSNKVHGKHTKHSSVGVSGVLKEAIYHPPEEIKRLPIRTPSVTTEKPAEAPLVGLSTKRFSMQKKKSLIEAPFLTANY